MMTMILLIFILALFFGVLTFCAVSALDYARHFREYKEDEDDET